MTDSAPAPAPDELDTHTVLPALRSPKPSPLLAALASDERYVQERLLGRGAMGAVYLVRDRETGEQLALKKLFHMDGRSVLRLKREFRAVADMSHPNLVKVYELGHAADGFFLAMEYVSGQDLQAHLGNAAAGPASSRIDAALSRFASRRAWLQELLLPAFHQLAAGVDALHRAGMLHRDLKPSNVLVAGRRVVVLDFGLVRELDPNAPKLTEDGAIAGTPAYMSPEQALGKPLSEASDWYAFGVMLYEALTGALPFDGSLAELLRNKVDRDPNPPEKLVADIPSELSALCMALLSRDPQARPPSHEVLARLDPARAQPAAQQLRAANDTSLQSETLAANAAPFFGRQAELVALTHALQAAEAGRSQVVHVRGLSGAGKSALIEHFLDELDQQVGSTGHAQVLVLRSRCYEREAMPFKALDGVIDALTRHLSALEDLQVSHLMPADIGLLVQLFPALERLRAVQRLLAVRSHGGDAVQNRQRAAHALRDLFSRLATGRPLVIWIDDVQWGDLDSAGILKDFVQRPFELPFVLLFSYRSDEIETSECLRLLLAAAQHELSAPATVVAVDTLPSADLSALCREQLGTLARGQDVLIERVVREASGSPFLAAQLTALAQAKLARGDRDVAAISLSGLVAQTAALLPADALSFLRVIAVAGRPISPRLALRAAELRGGGRDIIHALRRHLLLRTRDVAGEKLVEVYHDRVRETVQQALTQSESEQVHGSLLRALEFSGRSDPDWLYTHAVGAGQQVAALRYGFLAAERAMATLAFEHAAELYARCIELSAEPEREHAELTHKLADALACCGRGVKAADAYLRASMLATGPKALVLMRVATSHLFRSGRYEEGEAMLHKVLQAMGVRMPQTPLGVLLALLWERLRLVLRGARFTPRSDAEIPAAELERIDVFSLLRADLQSVDPLRATWFMLRGLRWALDAGEPLRMLYALSGLCHLVSYAGTARAERRSQQLLTQITTLSEKIGTPSALAVLRTTQAVTFWMRNRPSDVLAPAYEAERLYREQSLGTLGDYYARFAVVSTRIGALYQLGDYGRFAVELRSALAEARATENEGALLTLALTETLLDEIEDRCEESLLRLERQRRQLPKHGFSVYHALHMIAVCVAARATRNYAWGRALLDEDWPRFLRSPIRRTAVIALNARYRRLWLLLSEYSEPNGSRLHSLARLRKEAQALQRSGGLDARRLGSVGLARVTYLEGDKAGAILLLRNDPGHEDSFRFTKQYALGTLVGGAEGETLCAQSEAELRELGVVNPGEYLRATYPELHCEREGRSHG